MPRAEGPAHCQSAALAAAAGAGTLWAMQQLLRILSVRRQAPTDTPGSGGGCSGGGGGSSLWQQTPHPGWKPPQKQPAPFSGSAMHTVDPSHLAADVLYPLMISAVVPRPIGTPCMRVCPVRLPPGGPSAFFSSHTHTRHSWWCALSAAFVSTRSAAGVGNLAPFSYFNVVAHSPPHVVLGFAAASPSLRSHRRKDTLVNILETG